MSLAEVAPEDKAAPYELHPLSDDEIKSIVSAEINNTLGTLGSDLSEQRRKSIRYYNAEPFGNEEPGRSRVILSDVADTIEWAMPNLMQMLVPSNVVARFTSKDSEQAEQATAYCNHVLMNECNGYMILYELFKTALMEKTGYVQVFVDERTEPKIDSYYGLNDEELDILLGQEAGEPTARNEYPGPTGEMDPGSGAPIQGTLHDVKFRVAKTIKRIKVEGAPPEEVLEQRDMIELTDEYPSDY